MADEKIRLRLASAFSSLTAANVEILEDRDDYLTVSVVSDSFNGITFVTRVRQLIELVKANAPEIWGAYTLIFEAKTKTESVRNLAEKCGVESEDESEPRSIAARPFEAQA